MAFITWSDGHRIAQCVASIFAVLNNSFLIFLIVKKSPKAMGPYKNLLIQAALVEITYAVLELFVLPELYAYGSSVICFVDLEKSLFSPFVMVILDGVYSGAFGVSLYCFAIQFVYRYFVTCKSPLLATFENSKIIIWYTIPFIAGTMWGCAAYFLGGMSDLKTNYLAGPLLSDMGIDIYKTIYVAALFYPKDENGNYYIHWASVGAIGTMNTLMTIALAIIASFGTRCYRNLQKSMESSSFSASYQKLQTQLFWALIVQTSIPFCFLILPLSTAYTCTFFNNGLGLMTSVCTILIAFYLAVDPLPNFVIIKNYRKATLDYLKKLWCASIERKITQSSITNLSSHTNVSSQHT